MKSFLDTIREFIRNVKAHIGEVPTSIQTSKEVLIYLRLELDLGPMDPVIVDGVHIEQMPYRDMMLGKAIQYAAARWHIGMTLTDVQSLYEAVPDDELEALIPIVMAQHFDGVDIPDPVEEMSAADVKELKKTLEEIGIVDPDL